MRAEYYTKLRCRQTTSSKGNYLVRMDKDSFGLERMDKTMDLSSLGCRFNSLSPVALAVSTLPSLSL